MEDKNRESFVRWQSYTLRQFSFINNLLIGLCTGVLAIFFSSVLNNVNKYDICQKLLLSTAFVFIFLSLTSGVVTAWYRLLNFRTTTQVAKKRKEGDKKDIEDLRKEYIILGRYTWALLTAQLAFFILGSLFILVIVILRVVN